MSIIVGSGGGGGAPSGDTGTFPVGMIENSDYVSAQNPPPSPTQEIYTYRVGGAGGTIVKTVTVNYVDAFKDNVLNVTWV